MLTNVTPSSLYFFCLPWRRPLATGLAPLLWNRYFTYSRIAKISHVKLKIKLTNFYFSLVISMYTINHVRRLAYCLLFSVWEIAVARHNVNKWHGSTECPDAFLNLHPHYWFRWTSQHSVNVNEEMRNDVSRYCWRLKCYQPPQHHIMRHIMDYTLRASTSYVNPYTEPRLSCENFDANGSYTAVDSTLL